VLSIKILVSFFTKLSEKHKLEAEPEKLVRATLRGRRKKGPDTSVAPTMLIEGLKLNSSLRS
jgi:hypothetical protein